MYKNTTLQATRDASAWTYTSNGGYLGLSIVAGQGTFLDDYGGDTYTGAHMPKVLAKVPLAAPTTADGGSDALARPD